MMKTTSTEWRRARRDAGANNVMLKTAEPSSSATETEDGRRRGRESLISLREDPCVTGYCWRWRLRLLRDQECVHAGAGEVSTDSLAALTLTGGRLGAERNTSARCAPSMKQCRNGPRRADAAKPDVPIWRHGYGQAGQLPNTNGKRFMVTQEFPWFGKLGLRGVATKDAEAMQRGTKPWCARSS